MGSLGFLLSFALFCCLFVSFGYSQSNYLVYQNNPECSTGCDLLAAANWNGTITVNSTLSITTSQISTFIINNTYLEINALSFGVSGSPVTLLVNNATLNVKSSSFAGGLLWYSSSALYATDSIIVSMSIINGSSLFSQNSTFLGSIVSVLQATVNGGEFGAAGLVLSVGNLTISNSSLTSIGSDLYVNNLFSYNNSINVHNLRLANYSKFENCTFKAPMTVFFQNNSVAEFHDSAVNISEIFFAPGALFSFHSDNSNSSLMVLFATFIETSPVGSELHLGDYVRAFIGAGTIYNLTVGSGVILQLGDDLDDMWVNNMSQDKSDDFTTISVFTRLHLATSAPIGANIYVTGSAALYVDNLFLSNGSSISGDGQLNMNGILHCPTCNVSIPTVNWYWYDNTAPDLVVDTLYTTNIIYQNFARTSANVYGDVVLTPSTYNGIETYANYLVINGSYTQIGGYMNVTINKNTSSTTPLLQVQNNVWLQNVTIVVDAFLLLDDKSKYLIVNSVSDNMSITPGTSVINLDTSSSAAKLEMYRIKGGLFVQVKKGTGFNPSGGLKVWQIAAIAGGAVGGVVLIAIIIFAIKKMSHKRHYEKIHH